MMLQSNILSVIDLGSSKVSMACVKVSGQEVLEVLAFASGRELSPRCHLHLTLPSALPHNRQIKIEI